MLRVRRQLQLLMWARWRRRTWRLLEGNAWEGNGWVHSMLQVRYSIALPFEGCIRNYQSREYVVLKPNLKYFSETWILPSAVLLATVAYAVLAFVFYNNSGWFHFFYASPKQYSTRDKIFDVFNVVNVQRSMFNIVGDNWCFHPSPNSTDRYSDFECRYSDFEYILYMLGLCHFIFSKISSLKFFTVTVTVTITRIPPTFAKFAKIQKIFLKNMKN